MDRFIILIITQSALMKPVQLFGKTALRWIYGNLYLRQL